MPPVPERIGKYTISEVLGQGAMGVVYKGFDPHIQRPVAIKTIHKSLIGDPEVNAAQDSIAARFRNEAQAVGRIAHPGVVSIYEFGEDEHTAYIAMEFVEGRNLDQVLAGTPMLAEAQVLRIMDQLLDALAHAHAQGVWHRDIKPANLILTANGQVKLTDFGIARIANMGLTQVSSAIGTPGYMAPEQYIGEGIDQRADIFASGVLLYRLLTAKPAFSGTAEQVMYKILNEQPQPPSVVTQGARPAAYDAVVARAIAKKADARFQSAQLMRQALAQIVQGVGTPAADSDATVIVAAARPTSFASHSPTGSPVPMSSPGTALSHWDAQTLSRIERALATHVGPMAKLMVRDAARSCDDVVTLATAVSQHIADQAKRAQFVSAATAGSQTQAATLLTAMGTPAPTAFSRTQLATGGTNAGPPMSDEFTAKASQALIRRLGPIAKIMVKRAVEQCAGDRNRFVQTLLAAVPDADRPALERELNA
ncbi:MAG TPA: serine/threonine-protein kinase [Burkholderiaceae bacterium]|jgi:serine/threonine-protein kinase